MREHFIICDRCDLKEEFTLENYQLLLGKFEKLPKGWSVIDEKDYCPSCTKEYIKYKRRFK